MGFVVYSLTNTHSTQTHTHKHTHTQCSTARTHTHQVSSEIESSVYKYRVRFLEPEFTNILSGSIRLDVHVKVIASTV